MINYLPCILYYAQHSDFQLAIIFIHQDNKYLIECLPMYQVKASALRLHLCVCHIRENRVCDQERF